MRLRRRPTEQEELLLGADLFDEQWYGAQAGERLDRAAAVRHYLDHGVAAGHSPHPLFDPGYVRRRLGPKRLARLGDGDPLTFVLRRGLTLPTHPLLAPAAAGLVEGDLAGWVRERYAAWPARPEALATVPSPSVSIVVTCAVAPERTLVAARAAAETAAAEEVAAEVLVIDATGSAADGIVLDALRGLPGVRIERESAEPSADLVVLLHDHSKPRPGWLTPLVAALENPSVLAASPLLLGPSGALESAGVAFPSTGGLPYALLRDFPVEDAAAVGAVRFSALSGGALAVRRDDLAAVGGPDHSLGGLAEVDLCRRLAAHRAGRFRVVTDAHVRHPADPVDPDAGASYLARWPEGPADDVRLWAACGFHVLDHEIRRTDPAAERRLCVPEPVLMREARLQISESPRPLRWAIKNPAPAGPTAEEWGDTHFARDLAGALRSLGHEVVIDHREGFERPTARHDDVALALRGPVPYRPTPEHVSIAWVISHPHQVSAEELAAYDVVVAASVTWAADRSAAWALPIRSLLQATNPDRFHPSSALEGAGPDVLFVGNSRKTYRTIVRDAVEGGLPLTVYGADWETFLPDGVVAGTYLANAELAAAYRSAGVVLNDHWDDMRTEGFLSNRLFDAVASGARVVTDDVAGLGDLFGDSVRVYRDRDELARLCDPAVRAETFGSDDARLATARRVGREHSFVARARVLVELAQQARARRGFS
jgi:hypothetical protein